MTSALNPSPWYARLYGYKMGRPDEYMPLIASVIFTYLDVNGPQIAGLLGGDPTIITPVPSKRRKYRSQPLRMVLAGKRPPDERLKHVLDFNGDASADHRHRYFPDEFAPGPEGVSGQRVLVIEDSWVTGATCISAAGALLREGAAAIGILPVARIVDSKFWIPEHPYRKAMEADYRPDVWPRL
ncbi:MAG: phosphoribosyltransferase [Gammaproteobacteria bacterium]